MWQERRTRLVPVITWRMTGKAHQTCTCDYVMCDRNDAPDSYLWLRDVWQEWRTKFVPVITWRVTGMTHQTRTCDYVTCDRNDAPDSYLWLRDACFTLVNYRHLARSRGNNNDNQSRFSIGCILFSLATWSSLSLSVGRVCTVCIR